MGGGPQSALMFFVEGTARDEVEMIPVDGNRTSGERWD
jgi:hypothetical protein